MTLIDLPLHQQKTVTNYMNGRVLRHVAKIRFGTAGGKIDMNIMVEHLLVLFGYFLTHYTLKNPLGPPFCLPLFYR